MYLIYEIGNYGPIGLILLSWLLLWNHKVLFTYYTIGILLNIILNVFLKCMIQEPRPSVDVREFESMKKHAKHFFFQDGVPFHMLGMPSGHVQASSFSAIFMYFALKDIKLLYLYLCFTLITGYQRVAYRFHTIRQVCVGFLVGALFALYMYSIATNKLKGNIFPKMDDAAYFSNF